MPFCVKAVLVYLVALVIAAFFLLYVPLSEAIEINGTDYYRVRINTNDLLCKRMDVVASLNKPDDSVFVFTQCVLASAINKDAAK